MKLVFSFAVHFLRAVLCSLVVIPLLALANDIEPGSEFYTAVKAENPIVVDGDLSEWAGATRLISPRTSFPKGSGSEDYIFFEEWRDGTWSGPEDQSTVFQVVYDDENVYLGLVVTDDYHENSANSAWNGDSVQMMIANDARDRQIALYNYALGGIEGELGVIIAMHEAGPGGTEAVVVRDGEDKETVYEVRLPKAALELDVLEAGTEFGLGLLVNDGDEDSPGQQGWSGWGPHSIVWGRSPEETALITLGEFSPPESVSSYAQDFNAFPDGVADLGDGSVIASSDGVNTVQGGVLRMTQMGIDFTKASFVLPSFDASNGWSAQFSFTVEHYGDETPADGFSFNYGAIPQGENFGTPAEEGYGDLAPHISFQVDTWLWDNVGQDAGVGIEMTGQQLGFTQAIGDEANFKPGERVSGTAYLSWHPETGASFHTTGLRTNAAFNNIATPEFVPDGSYGFSFLARTSGHSETVEIDNVIVNGSPGVPSPPPLIPMTLEIEGQGVVDRSPPGDLHWPGTHIELTAVPDPGWTFVEWRGAVLGSENPVRFTLTEPADVTAVFEQVFTVEARAEPGGTVEVSPEASHYPGGTEVTLTALPQEGHRFLGWSGDASGTGNPLTVSVDSDREYTAHFVALTRLSVGTRGQGGVAAAPDKILYDVGERVTLTAMPADGWRFVEWQGTVSGRSSTIEFAITERMAVLAVFDQYFGVDADAGDGGEVIVSPVAASYRRGTEITLTAIPQEGYRFHSWSGGDAEVGENPLAVTVGSHLAYQAHFVPVTTLTLTEEGEGSVAALPNKVHYDVGEDVTLTAVPAEGWTFVEWRGSVLGMTNPMTVPVHEEMEVTAVFDQFFAVEASAEEGGQVTRSPEAASYRRGTEVTLTAIPQEGYRFDGWSGDASGEPSTLTVSVESDLAYTARFVPVTELALNHEGEGSVAALPNKVHYDVGEDVTLTALPAEGWTFVEWRGSVLSMANPITVAVIKGMEVTALFDQFFAVEASAEEGGQVTRSPEAASYRRGTEVTLTAIPQEGYRFDGWSGDAGGDAVSLTVSVEENLAYTARFVPVTTLTLTQEGEGDLVVSPDKARYDLGESVRLSAAPAEGWTFIRWSGALDSEENPVTLVVAGKDPMVRALFRPIHAVHVDSIGAGTVSQMPQGLDHVEGTEVTLTAEPEAGFEFVRWEGVAADRAAENPIAFTVDGPKTLTAVFEEIEVDPPFVVWAEQYFSASAMADPSISGAQADPDGDGLKNLLEMVLGTNPLDPSSRSGLAVEPWRGGVTGEYFVMADIRRREGVELHLEISHDLETWFTGEGAGMQYADLVAVEPIGEGMRYTWRVFEGGFCRLAAELPEGE